MSRSSGPPDLGSVESLRLLRSAPLGRLVYTVDALPAVQPALFSLQDDRLIIFTGKGDGLADIADDTVVAFQAEDIDVTTCRGWSVTVIGHGATVSDPEDAAELFASLSATCHLTEPAHVFRLSIERVDGRRIGES